MKTKGLFFVTNQVFPLHIVMINPKKSKSERTTWDAPGVETFEWLCPLSHWQVLTFTQLLGVTWTQKGKFEKFPNLLGGIFLFEGQSTLPKKLRFWKPDMEMDGWGDVPFSFFVVIFRI